MAAGPCKDPTSYPPAGFESRFRVLAAMQLPWTLTVSVQPTVIVTITNAACNMQLPKKPASMVDTRHDREAAEPGESPITDQQNKRCKSECAPGRQCLGGGRHAARDVRRHDRLRRRQPQLPRRKGRQGAVAIAGGDGQGGGVTGPGDVGDAVHVQSAQHRQRPHALF